MFNLPRIAVDRAWSGRLSRQVRAGERTDAAGDNPRFPVHTIFVSLRRSRNPPLREDRKRWITPSAPIPPYGLTNQRGAVLELSDGQVGLMANADLSGLAITMK